jgi:hypothetical protein
MRRGGNHHGRRWTPNGRALPLAEEGVMTTTIDIAGQSMSDALDGPDKCDRCSAAAKVTAVLPAGELRFCWHHARAHWARLVAIGANLSWDTPPSRKQWTPPWRKRLDAA